MRKLFLLIIIPIFFLFLSYSFVSAQAGIKSITGTKVTQNLNSGKTTYVNKIKNEVKKLSCSSAVPIDTYEDLSSVIPSGLLSDTTWECYNCGNCSVCDIMSVFVVIATRIFFFAGGLALIIFIWGGIELIMSQGYSEKVQSGRQKMRGTVVGLIIIMLAWLLVGTIISVITGGGGIDIGGTKQKVSVGKSALNWYELPDCPKPKVPISKRDLQKKPPKIITPTGCCTYTVPLDIQKQTDTTKCSILTRTDCEMRTAGYYHGGNYQCKLFLDPSTGKNNPGCEQKAGTSNNGGLF